jgi:hypothetical protein
LAAEEFVDSRRLRLAVPMHFSPRWAVIRSDTKGFFDPCHRRGLTGKQGVLIPEANVGHLMLREDLIAAVRDESFHIHGVRTVGEGLNVLSQREAREPRADGSSPRAASTKPSDRR